MASRREQAGLPPGRELSRVTLDAMRQLSLPASNDEINEAVADVLELTKIQRTVSHHPNSNRSELAYRVAWERTLLRTAGAAKNVGRALWTLTDEGWSITPEVVQQRYKDHLAGRPSEERQIAQGQSAEGGRGSSQDIEGLHDDDWRNDLLDRMKGISPAGFEHLSAALLRASGFDDVEVIGRSGDGGIDGIGTYRPSGLISFHTAFQCKRYQGSVGAGAIRDFRGSFVGRADRGIILTTGHFTRDARDEASRPGANPVDLIDGETFCDLLREHSLGVRTTQRVVEDVTIDDTYFNQFENSS